MDNQNVHTVATKPQAEEVTREIQSVDAVTTKPQTEEVTREIQSVDAVVTKPATEEATREVIFSLNEVFNSFDELDKKIKEYEVKKAVQLWRRDSRTIETASKRVNRYLDKRIKYYELTYSCIHGGRKFVAKGEGKRATQ